METILALFAFAIATSITPGPNVLMVASGAARNGIGAVWPLMLGISAGFALMLLIVGAGLAAPLAASNSVYLAMKWLGAAWLCWLAWKIASAPVGDISEGKPPLGFAGAMAFQWVNPKAWMIAVAALPTFQLPDMPMLLMAGIIALAFGCVSLPCLLVWALLGQSIRVVLSKPGKARAFNIVMGLLLMASVVPGLVAGR
ncbi:LysE family translocator [Acetobacteraceae bacterium H6797]|nr:LysE family translocator [Acetobacteraceae bacterium H6797]